jgi:surface protein
MNLKKFLSLLLFITGAFAQTTITCLNQKPDTEYSLNGVHYIAPSDEKHLVADILAKKDLVCTSYITTLYNLNNLTNDFLPNNLSTWDTRRVTNMGATFEGATSFNQDISSWDTSKVTDMSHMFDTSVFNHSLITNNNSWNTSSVINMSHMFDGDIVFNGDIGSWNTKNVKNMSYSKFYLV